MDKTNTINNQQNYILIFEKAVLTMGSTVLSKSLKEQLESAKHEVLIAQRRLRKRGELQAYTLEGKKVIWRSCLEFIDTHVMPENCEQSADLLSAESDYFLAHYLNTLTLLTK